MFQHVKEGGEHGRGEEKPFNTSSEEKIYWAYTTMRKHDQIQCYRSHSYSISLSLEIWSIPNNDEKWPRIVSHHPPHSQKTKKKTVNSLCSHPKFFNSHWAHMFPHSQPGLAAVPLRGETPQNEFKEVLFFTQSVELHDVFSACEVGFFPSACFFKSLTYWIYFPSYI